MALREEVEQKYQRNPLTTTKEGQPFRVQGIRANSVYVEIASGEEPIRIATLERAVELLRSGVRISGPADFRIKVADERPAYAWAILRDLGYTSAGD